MNSLADISAGLGTDMNRIILAYGQIQAAGVLKGTELRQLTELGLPMVDLLAQYYSTLRNEVITTSQVFEMISKKEIPFEAVKEILQDLTEEGGRFFEMQKTQSETLYGQWTNMKDALHIMMDEIGRTEEVQDIFRSLIDSVHWLTNNWERLFKTVRNFLFIYGSLKSVTLVTQLYAITLSRLAVGAQRWAKISSLFSAINLRNAATTTRSTAANIKHIFSLQALKSAAKKAALGIKTLSISLAKLMLANPTGWIMAIVSALMLLDFSMKKSTSATDKFLQKQKELVQGASANVKNLEAEFKRLANIVVTSEDNSNEQNKALRKLKDQFGDMIPEYQLTSEYLRKLKDDTDNLTSGFDNLTGSIRQYAANQLIETLKENVKIKAQEIFSDMYGSLAGTAWTSWINAGLQIIESDDSANEIRAAMLRLYGKVYTTDVFPYKRPDGTFTNMPIPEEGYGLSRDEFAKFMNALEAKNAQAHKFFSFLLKTWELETMSANIAKDAHWLDTSSARIKRMEKELERINNEIGGNSLKEADESKQSLRTEYFITQLEKLRKEAGLSEQVTNDVIDSIQRLKAEIREKPKGEQTPEMTSLYKDLNEMLNLYGYYDDAWRAKLVGLQRYIFDDTQKISAYAIDQINQFVNLSDALEGAAKDYKELKEQKERLEKTLASPSLEPDTEDKEKKRLEKTQTRMELLYEFLKMYNALDLLEDKKKGKNPKIKQLEDELATVEKIYKKYQDFRKYMGDEEARAKTKEYFKDVEFQWLKMAFTPEEFKTQANEALRIVKTFAGDTKKVQQNIQFKIGDIDFDDEKVLIEKEMKRLSDQLSRTKTAKEFFDNMLGLTGDKQLSATLTMSVYGVTQDANLGSELGKSIAKQMQDQVQTYFGDVDISSAINKATSEIDPIGLEKLLTEENIAKIGEKDVENIRKIISDLISSDAKFWEEMMKDLGKTQTYGDKLVKVYETLQSRIEKIRSREDLDETTKASLIDQVKANAEKEMSKLQYEAFKDSPLYVAMFEKLDATSTTMLTNMRNHLEALRGEWANSLDPSQLKELQKRINEIDKQLVSRNPFKGIIDGFKEFNALSETRSRKDDESEAFDATKKRLKAERAYQRAVSEGKPSDEIARLAEELDKCVDAEDKATEKCVSGMMQHKRCYKVFKN
jgi:tape measure domain-containing protein